MELETMRKSPMWFGALALIVVAAPAMAQDESAETAEAEASEAEPLADMPADSMAIGDQYAEWFLDYDAESLREKFSDDLKERLGSVGDMIDQMGQFFDQIGVQETVVSQRYWIRQGERQFWHTAKFSGAAENIVIRFVIQPDGTITGIGINPESQNPPVDDPNQHGDIDS